MDIDHNKVIEFYKREDIQNELLRCSNNKEVVGSFKGEGYSKRPDILKYPNDIMELVKQGVTSFHISEETWKNPLQIDPMLKKKDLNNMRSGWDLVLDIDCPIWKIAKITTWLIIKGLKDHNISSISVKFSGNKGFHRGVPFESFPKTNREEEISSQFPEIPRKIALYLLDYITSKYIRVENNESIILGGKFNIPIQELMKTTKKNINQLTKKFCTECNREVKGEKERKIEFVCKKCGSTVNSTNDSYMECPKCKVLMEKLEYNKTLCKCGSNEIFRKFNPLSIIEVDTILISTRHLYRAPFSFNEKSGLVSVPIDSRKVLQFEKEDAKPEKAKVEFKFLDRDNAVPNEANQLIDRATKFSMAVEEEQKEKNIEYEEIKEAIPEQFFPPCLEQIKKGLSDGRKRSVFILINFLTSVGWSHDQIDKYLREWNKNNDEELREVNFIGQLRYHKQQKKKILPPNCSNAMYYKDIGICKPNKLCEKIKNPVNYAKIKVKSLNQQKKTKKKKKK